MALTGPNTLQGTLSTSGEKNDHHKPNALLYEPDGQPVMALHSSGSNAKQWQYLKNLLGGKRHFILPQLGETEKVAGGWTMENYKLECEAKPLVRQLKQLCGPSHLIGHSFGGAVALHIARTHPDLVASICLYEPTAFHVLRNGNRQDRRLFQDLEILGISVQDAVDRGMPEFGAQLVTEFWGGFGAWEALSAKRREELAKWASKAPLDCGALLYEDILEPISMCIPATLIYGTETNLHTRRITEVLGQEIKKARIVAHSSANHLGPIVYREQTAILVQQHLGIAERAAYSCLSNTKT